MASSWLLQLATPSEVLQLKIMPIFYLLWRFQGDKNFAYPK